MPIVFQSDLHRYIDKQDIRNLRRYQGKAIWLPDGRGLQYMNKFKDVEVNTGDGIMDVIGSIANFVKDNKETISGVTDTFGKVASTVTGIVKGAEEIENIRALRRKALEDAKKGNALYLPDDKNGDALPVPSLGTQISKSEKDSEVAKKIAKRGKGFKLMNPS